MDFVNEIKKLQARLDALEAKPASKPAAPGDKSPAKPRGAEPQAGG